MLFGFAFSIDEDVIEVHYYKNIEFFCQNLNNVALKHSRCIGQSKKHDQVFKVAIADLEDHLPFIVFPNSYLMVGISQIKLGKTSSST